MTHKLDNSEIVNLYLSGKSSIEIGEIFGVSRKVILRRLRKNGIEIRSQTKTLPMGDIIKMYNGGYTLKDIGKKFNYSPTTIKKNLKIFGIKIRKSLSDRSLKNMSNVQSGRFVSEETKILLSNITKKQWKDGLAFGKHSEETKMGMWSQMVRHHYLYDHDDINKYVILVPVAYHAKLHAMLQRLGIIISHINITEKNKNVFKRLCNPIG